MATKYPECEKMEAVADKSQVIGEFLEWLDSPKGLNICEYSHGLLYPVSFTAEKLLAEFFGIDLDKVEKEKRQMLKELRGK